LTRRVNKISPRFQKPGRVQAKTAARGYGTAHQRLRKELAPKVAAGLFNCARCGSQIQPGEAWDLGHSDHNRSRYSGPEHAACNRATSGRRKKRPSRHSQVW
jgi:hypothetical protein